MISCLIPKEKLLDMYLNHEGYETDYSYPQMMEEFDEKYAGSLDEQEQEVYKYPYLKLITDVIKISENARKNPKLALESLQSAMKTCFNAYLIKLDNIQEFDVDKAKKYISK